MLPLNDTLESLTVCKTQMPTVICKDWPYRSATDTVHTFWVFYKTWYILIIMKHFINMTFYLIMMIINMIPKHPVLYLYFPLRSSGCWRDLFFTLPDIENIFFVMFFQLFIKAFVMFALSKIYQSKTMIAPFSLKWIFLCIILHTFPLTYMLSLETLGFQL